MPATPTSRPVRIIRHADHTDVGTAPGRRSTAPRFFSKALRDRVAPNAPHGRAAAPMSALMIASLPRVGQKISEPHHPSGFSCHRHTKIADSALTGSHDVRRAWAAHRAFICNARKHQVGNRENQRIDPRFGAQQLIKTRL